MTVYDCFMYYNERDVLRLRLEELSDVIDYFIVVEASQTFTGKDKPLYFDFLPEWIHKWNNKIIRYVVDFPRQDMTPWEREYYQRDSLLKAIPHGQSDDILLFSDADEIINRNSIQRISYPAQLNMNQYFWKLNWQVPNHCNQGARPIITQRSLLNNSAISELRRTTSLPRIGDYGWHFSFLNAEELAKDKIEAFAHTEVNQQEFKSLAHIRKCTDDGIDPFMRFPLKYRTIDESYPLWVQQNIASVQHLIHNIKDNNE